MEGAAGFCPPFLPSVAPDNWLGEAGSPPTSEFGESESRVLLWIFSDGDAREVTSLGQKCPFCGCPGGHL